MAQLKIGDKFRGNLVGYEVEWEVSALLPDGMVELTQDNGAKQVVTAETLLSVFNGALATAPVAGLQADPPAHLTRFAEKGIAVLPSPVAPEQSKSGIIETGEVKYVGLDGLVHVMP
jgi:hypothetical protein